jgi:hypothetical protein
LFCAKKKKFLITTLHLLSSNQGFHFFWGHGIFWLFLKKFLKKPWENEYFPSVKKKKKSSKGSSFSKDFFFQKKKN